MLSRPLEDVKDRCDFCGRTDWTVHLSCSDFPSGGLIRCSQCGLIRVARLPSREEILGYYQDGYYKAWGGRFSSFVESFVYLFRLRRAHDIMALAPRGRVLDVGCGRGIMLALLKRAGWEVVGTQVSKNAAAYARETLGIDVFEGDLLAARFVPRSFDVVTLYQVLEHLPNPGAYLTEIHRLLKPGGWLILDVPNAGGFEARYYGCAWLGWDSPRHLYHFTPEVLIAATEERGLQVVATRFFSLEYGPFTLVQSSLNALGCEKNFLFEFLQATSATARRRFRPSQVIAHGLLAGLLAAPSLLAVAFLSGLKMSNNFTVVCRKAQPEPGSG